MSAVYCLGCGHDLDYHTNGHDAVCAVTDCDCDIPYDKVMFENDLAIMEANVKAANNGAELALERERKLRAENERLEDKIDDLRVNIGHLEEKNRFLDYLLRQNKISNITLINAKKNLRAENVRMRKALEVYADDKNWNSRGGYHNCFWTYSENGLDEGPDLARHTLEGDDK